MRVALVSPPFLPVPPKKYGGTELFIAQLAEGLAGLRASMSWCTPMAESTVEVEKRWLLSTNNSGRSMEKSSTICRTSIMLHGLSAMQPPIATSSICNNVPALMFTRFVPDSRFIYTLHHVQEEELSKLYQYFPQVEYVTISDFQRARESMARMRTIHHGIDLTAYQPKAEKQEYLSFLGRIAPIKGTHLAIEVAKRSGIPLKIAGEMQPIFQDYFDTQIKPHIDGKFIEYVGEADLAAKNELLGNSLAMLFPIQWNEPFGLVMIEAMACGTPVLALPGGAVDEVVQDGVSGFVCQSADEMVERAVALPGAFSAANVRQYCQHISRLKEWWQTISPFIRNCLARAIRPVNRLAESPWWREETFSGRHEHVPHNSL